jgi:LPS sulfotransferase NodH
MVCALQRSGSTYLCQLLSSTELLGKPDEYLNTPGKRLYSPKYPKDPRVQLDIIRSRGATSNGIYAVKVHPLHFSIFGDKIDPFRDLPDLRLVRLRRRDLLGQAISLARARESRQFNTADPQTVKPTYSAERIRLSLQFLFEQKAMWDEIIERLGVQPLELAYEDILENPQQAVDEIASLMGLTEPVTVNLALVASAIQRDDSSEAWRRQFLAETGMEFRGLIAS